jgi:hypothetical protein
MPRPYDVLDDEVVATLHQRSETAMEPFEK